MGPTLQQSYDNGIRPLVANEIGVEQALERAGGPLRTFMQKNVREKDLKLFMDLSREPPPATPEQMSMRILIPAFMISELKRAFEIGFLLFLPFLIIDLVVASVLMSMGMMMLPPVVVSLPFKLIFFVLVDGWTLVAGSLVQSYGGVDGLRHCERSEAIQRARSAPNKNAALAANPRSGEPGPYSSSFRCASVAIVPGSKGCDFYFALLRHAGARA